jgi:tRNA (guanine-N(7)-)-methyltransferase
MPNSDFEVVLSDIDLVRPLPLDKFMLPSQRFEVEIGCGNGRFLVAQAQKNPKIFYLGIERMKMRVRKVERKVRRLELQNLKVLRLDAVYTFYYLLPPHCISTVYVFFPDPWPKRHHHERRLFSPLFLDALWSRLIVGGSLQVATDHQGYFTEIQRRLTGDERFQAIAPMQREADEQTDFEIKFREEGLPIMACGFKTLPGFDKPLHPLKIEPSREPGYVEG